MKCPKCELEMQRSTYQGVEVDRCSTCNGIFLDQGEVEHVLNQGITPLIESGVVHEAAKKADLKPATCHTCERPMQPMRGLANVLFDYCITCRGMFLDAGELSAIQAYKTKHGV